MIRTQMNADFQDPIKPNDFFGLLSKEIFVSMNKKGVYNSLGI